MLRVGMTNPPYILEHLAVVAQVLRHPKVYAFLHVPVQAGSNRVLVAMNREYTVEEYMRVADYLIEVRVCVCVWVCVCVCMCVRARSSVGVAHTPHTHSPL